ncbi:MAG: heparan-alpha-glucosaminide N-acetyltransferase domain-containing protein [Chloroflexota bacterium]
MDSKNSKRIVALDLARCLAMIMMIQGHTVFALVSPEAIDISQFPWNVWNFLRGVTAPIFLLVSGASHVFANKRAPDGSLPMATFKRRVRMSLMLMAVGYILVFPAEKIYDLPFIDPSYFQPFFSVNILQLFGVSLFMLTLLFYFTRSDRQVAVGSLIIASAITMLTPAVHAIDWFSILPNPIASYFSLERGSIFVIFPFTAFLFYGAALGIFLKNVEPAKRNALIIKWGGLAGIAIFAIGYPISLIFSNNPFLYFDALKVDPGLVFMRLGLVLMAIWFAAVVYSQTPKMGEYYSILGKKALYIYVIHLLLIYGTPVFPGFEDFYFRNLTVPQSFAAAAIVISATLGITFALDYYQKTSRRANDLFRYSLTAYLIYVFFI